MYTYKYFYIIYIAVFCSIFWEESSFAQIPQRPNYTDDEGLRQGEWVIPFLRYKTKTLVVEDTTLVSFYRLITYKDGKPIGKVRDFYKNKKIYLEADALVSETPETYEGKVIYYHKNGKVHQIKSYQHTKLVEEKTYNLDGSIAQESWEYLYQKGNESLDQRKNQEAQQYFEKSKLQAEVEFGKQHQRYVLSCYNLGLSYHRLAKYQEAELEYQKARNISGDIVGLHHPVYALACGGLARLYSQLGQFEEARSLYFESKEIYAKVLGNNALEYAVLCYSLGVLYYRLRDLKNAEKNILEAKNVYHKILDKNAPQIIDTNNLLGALYAKQQKYQQAEQVYLKNIRTLKNLNKKKQPIYFQTITNLAVIYKLLGRIFDAEPLLLEALQLQGSLVNNNPFQYAIICENLAMIYNNQWRFSEAEPLFLQALDIKAKTKGKEHLIYANSCNNLGNLYRHQGLYDKAENYYIIAKNINAKKISKYHPDYIGVSLNLAIIYTEQGRLKKAKQTALEILQISQDSLGKDRQEYAQICRVAANIYFKQRQFAKAESLLLESKRIEEKVVGKNHKYALSCLVLGMVYTKQKRYEEAISLIEEAKAIQLAYLGKQHNDYMRSCNSLALLYEEIDQAKKAERLYLESIQLKLKEYTQNLIQASELEQSFYLKKNQYFFDDFKNFALNQARAGSNHLLADLLTLQLTLKGYLLNNTVKIRNRILQSGDSILIQQFRQWQGIKSQIAQAHNLSVKEREEKNISIQTWEEEMNQREKKLRSLIQGFTKATDTTNLDWKQVQNLLQEDEAALEMIRMPFQAQGADQSSTVYLALLITPQTVNSPDFLVLENGAQLENKYLQIYHHNLRQLDIKDTTSYPQYWKAIHDYCKLYQIKKLYFSPDGVFHQINLNTLQNPQTGQYVLDEIEIHQISYLKDLLNTTKHSQNTPKAILFGHPAYKLNSSDYSTYIDELASTNVYRALDLDQELSKIQWKPLPGTAKEVQNIAQTLAAKQWQTNIYLQKEATEEALKQIISPKVLHLATHGFFFNQNNQKDSTNKQTAKDLALNPMYRSGIVLSGVENYFRAASKPDTEDGILTAIEASTLNLNDTELVVLSACETAQGDIAPGEGIYGLQRGFQIAGAKTILMSLWKVKDVIAQQFMTSFYKHWQQGYTKREAFRLTQKELKSIYKSPAYWGAFILVGE